MLRFSLLFFLFHATLFAEDFRYFFYKATKGDVTLHIFGSMHVGKPDDPDYPPKVYTALHGSRMFILEGEVRREKIRTPDLSLTRLADGRSIRNLLTKKENAQLEKVCTAIGVRLATFENFEPWFLEFMFGFRMAFNQGFVLEYGTEHRLLRYLDKKYPLNVRPHIFALEGNDEVLRHMHNLPMADQLQRFRSFLTYSEEKGESNAIEMREHWRRGADEKVLQIFNYYYQSGKAEPNRYTRVLLFDRNRRMAERLNIVARYPGQYFVVTGALHLIGPQNILTHLEKSGFKVERQ